MKKFSVLAFVVQFYLLFFYVKLLTWYYSFVGNSHENAPNDVLYLEGFTRDGAGYTYRVKHWLDLLSKDGFKVDSSLIIDNAVDFFKETKAENLPKFLIKSIIIRIKQIKYSRKFKMVIVRRNLLVYNQYGNHFMEKLLVSAHSNRVLDFDDDIGATINKNLKRSLFEKIMLTSASQFYGSFQYYKGFIVGSDYLKEIVKSKLEEVSESAINVIPTCVYYTNTPAKKYNLNDLIIFGWIGGNQNLRLLKAIIPYLNELSKNQKICLHVVAGVESYDLDAKFPVVFKQYSLEKEVEYLKEMDIGLMPLFDDKVSRGKCGFKLLQYMGVGVPGIATAITINKKIIKHNYNGWLVDPNDDWLPILKKAVSSKRNLAKLGGEARSTVDQHYSFKSNYSKYVNFIKQFIN